MKTKGSWYTAHFGNHNTVDFQARNNGQAHELAKVYGAQYFPGAKVGTIGPRVVRTSRKARKKVG